MRSPRILFIGGTGVTSFSCVEHAAQSGFAVSVLNRGKTTIRPVPDSVEVITADVRDPELVRAAIGSREFDAVVDFLAYHPDHVRLSLNLLRGRIGQYLFISSASAYQFPPPRLPIVESSPLRNSHEYQYSLDKIACEELLARIYREEGLPITIVRPARTYDCAAVALPPLGGWTTIDRMRKGLPVVVPGDGTSLYVLTHAADFARGLIGLVGNSQAFGETFHITSDELLTWNQIYEAYAAAAGARLEVVHIASDTIAQYEPKFGKQLHTFHAHSMIFDNRKVKAVVPDYVAKVAFAAGAQGTIDWHEAHPEQQVIEPEINRLHDKLIAFATAGKPD